MTDMPEVQRNRPRKSCGKGHPGSFGEGAHRLCGAQRKRDGLPCQKVAMKGKARCRSHGGASTGPRTAEGKASQRRAVTKHGLRAGPGNPVNIERYGTDKAGPLWKGHREARGRLTKRDKELLARVLQEETV